jgi:Fe-S oxidoreductase
MSEVASDVGIEERRAEAAAELAAMARQTNAWACYDCGKCTATCPITRSGAAYSPRRHVLATNLGDGELASEETLFSCLTCSQCDTRCPAQVNYTTLVQKLRQLAFKEGVEPACPHGGALQSMMRMMATGGTQQDRLGWLGGDLRTDPKQGRVFYWTGCTMYYDAFFPEFESATLEGTKAAIRLLNRLGETPVVSPEERCCGHDLLWNGDRASFEKLAEFNVGLVAGSGAEVLVVSCAECIRTWKLDYEPFFKGKMPKIMHLTEFVAERLPELRFKGLAAADGNGDASEEAEGAAGGGNGDAAPASDAPSTVTYQDPCRLGRHLQIYDPPRQLLDAVPGIELAEMRHHRRGALCCAGGTWSDCDRFAKSIQIDRLREARATGAQTLVTACPKCQVHFRCAMKDPNLGDEVRVELRDVAELVADALAETESI